MPLAPIVAAALVAAAPPSARYEFLSGGKVTGALVRSVEPGGAVRVEFAYVENGRGPKLVETIRLDASGRVVAHEVTGMHFRDVDALQLNKVSLQHYLTTEDAAGHSNRIWFDDVVVATEYIGPMVGDVPPDVTPDMPPDAPPDEPPDVSPDAPPDPADAVTDRVDAPPPDGPLPDVVSDGVDAPADAAGDGDGEGDGGGDGCGCRVSR